MSPAQTKRIKSWLPVIGIMLSAALTMGFNLSSISRNTADIVTINEKESVLVKVQIALGEVTKEVQGQTRRIDRLADATDQLTREVAGLKR